MLDSLPNNDNRHHNVDLGGNIDSLVDHQAFKVDGINNHDSQRVRSPSTIRSEPVQRKKPKSILRSAPPKATSSPKRSLHPQGSTAQTTTTTFTDDENLNRMLKLFRRRRDNDDDNDAPPRTMRRHHHHKGADDRLSGSLDDESLSTTWSSDDSIANDYHHHNYQDQRCWDDVRRRRRRNHPRPPYWKTTNRIVRAVERSPTLPNDRPTRPPGGSRELVHDAEDQRRADCSNARTTLTVHHKQTISGYRRRHDGVVGAIILCLDRMSCRTTSRRRSGDGGNKDDYEDGDSRKDVEKNLIAPLSVVSLLARSAFGRAEYETTSFFSSSSVTYRRTRQGGASVFFASALVVTSAHSRVPGWVFVLLCLIVPPIVTLVEIRSPHRIDEISIALGLLLLRLGVDRYIGGDTAAAGASSGVATVATTARTTTRLVSSLLSDRPVVVLGIDGT